MKKLIKSGAGAGYTVSIKGIELDDRNYKIISDEITDERYNEHTTRVEVPVKPCVVDEWSAESYYDTISSEHDFFDSTEDSKIEGGKAVLDVFWYQSEEGRNINDVEFESAEEACDALIPKDFGIQVLVGAGWAHFYLPVDKVHFEDEYHHNPLNYYEDGYDCAVISADLVCPNICQDINAFFENPEEYYDDYQGDEEIESSKKIRSGYSNNPDYVGDWYGKGQIDYSKIINPEDSGNVYMVKLWSGSGYVLDVYLAKAEDVYEAMDKVFKWSYENEGENKMVFDYNYLENQAADDYKNYEKHPDSWSYYGEGLSEEEFIDKWIDEAFVSDDNGLYAHSENFFVDKLPEEYLNQSRKTIKSANSYGWEVDSSEVPEALDLFVEYVGKETALEEIARAMGTDVLEENLDWVIRQWGFAEDVEDMDDVWEKFEYAKEVMGADELYENLTQAAGRDELAEDLAFIFRQYDFREWDERKGNIDSGCHGKGKKKGKKEIKSDREDRFVVKIALQGPSGEWDNVGYADWETSIDYDNGIYGYDEDLEENISPMTKEDAEDLADEIRRNSSVEDVKVSVVPYVEIKSSRKAIKSSLTDTIRYYCGPGNRMLTHGDVEGYSEGELTPGDCSDIINELSRKLIRLADAIDEDDLEAFGFAYQDAWEYAREYLTGQSYGELDKDIFAPARRKFMISQGLIKSANNCRKEIKSSRDVKTRIDKKIEFHDLPFECVNASIDDGHLDMTIVEHLKGYGSSKTREKVINGKGDGESFEFDDTLKYEEAVCLPYLVKQGTSYPTAYFQDVYKRKDVVPFSTATIHLIKEYD